jgi:hypothetical protein
MFLLGLYLTILQRKCKIDQYFKVVKKQGATLRSPWSGG